MLSKVDQHVMKKLPSNAEASNVLVGEVDSLPHTVIAFVRLASGALLGDLTKPPAHTDQIHLYTARPTKHITMKWDAS